MSFLTTTKTNTCAWNALHSARTIPLRRMGGAEIDSSAQSTTLIRKTAQATKIGRWTGFFIFQNFSFFSKISLAKSTSLYSSINPFCRPHSDASGGRSLRWYVPVLVLLKNKGISTKVFYSKVCGQGEELSSFPSKQYTNKSISQQGFPPGSESWCRHVEWIGIQGVPLHAAQQWWIPWFTWKHFYGWGVCLGQSVHSTLVFPYIASKQPVSLISSSSGLSFHVGNRSRASVSFCASSACIWEAAQVNGDQLGPRCPVLALQDWCTKEMSEFNKRHFDSMVYSTGDVWCHSRMHCLSMRRFLHPAFWRAQMQEIVSMKTARSDLWPAGRAKSPTNFAEVQWIESDAGHGENMTKLYLEEWWLAFYPTSDHRAQSPQQFSFCHFPSHLKICQYLSVRRELRPHT